MDLIILLAIVVAVIAGWWKMFEKAGQPGWAAIIPIYNLIIYLKVAGKPIWWIILLLIPLVNLVVTILISIEVAKNFGKGVVFAIVGLWLFTPIGVMILGFGDATYSGKIDHQAAF